jgi:hypothetical protein
MLSMRVASLGTAFGVPDFAVSGDGSTVNEVAIAVRPRNTNHRCCHAGWQRGMELSAKVVHAGGFSAMCGTGANHAVP